MLSSRFVRSLASRGLRMKPSQIRFDRSLHNSTRQLQAAGATAVKQEEEKGIIDSYGGYLPFVGGLAAIALGKEAFIINEEFLLAINTCSFIFTGYVAVGDSFSKMVEESNAAAKAKFDKATDAALCVVQNYKDNVNRKFVEVEVLRELVEEQHEAAVGLVAYENAKIRHAAYSEMVAKLESIKAREDAEAAARFDSIVNLTVGKVKAAYEGPNAKNLKANSLKFAIENIGKSPPADPVTQLFAQTVDAGKSGKL